MDMKRTLYLANPFGFSALTALGPLRSLVEALEDLGAAVWEPFTNVDLDDAEAPQWAWRTGQANVNALFEADGVFAVLNGQPPDEGVMVEVGLAIAWGKPVFFFRDDVRRCSDSDVYPLNLMIFAGCTAEGWRNFWYASLDDLADPAKHLVRWLGGAELDRVARDGQRAGAREACPGCGEVLLVPVEQVRPGERAVIPPGEPPDCCGGC